MFVVQMVSYHGFAQEIVGPFGTRAEAAAWAGLQVQARVGAIKELTLPTVDEALVGASEGRKV